MRADAAGRVAAHADAESLAHAHVDGRRAVGRAEGRPVRPVEVAALRVDDRAEAARPADALDVASRRGTRRRPRDRSPGRRPRSRRPSPSRSPRRGSRRRRCPRGRAGCRARRAPPRSRSARAAVDVVARRDRRGAESPKTPVAGPSKSAWRLVDVVARRGPRRAAARSARRSASATPVVVVVVAADVVDRGDVRAWRSGSAPGRRPRGSGPARPCRTRGRRPPRAPGPPRGTRSPRRRSRIVPRQEVGVALLRLDFPAGRRDSAAGRARAPADRPRGAPRRG